MKTISIEVQVQISSGLPCFSIVGLADKAITESRERIRSSFHGVGLTLPSKHITVNLSPADIVKEGSHYDLPIALGILCSMGILPSESLKNFIVLGELSLDGQIQRVSGILPASLEAAKLNCGIICPKLCLSEAQWSGNDNIVAANSLIEIVNHFTGRQIIVSSNNSSKNSLETHLNELDFQDVRGQEYVKKAIEIAAAGGHNLLMLGPPGSGKSMLAARLPSILPPLTPMESLEVTMVHSLAGLVPKEGLITQRPFRSPHHSASLAALVGGGARTKPGEISLAHRGVLFLDEMPEFSRITLEALRQPLETGVINIARANFHASYPARIQLIGAMNPCRCGYFGDLEKQCKRVPVCGQEYQNKLSGPLLDRFDMAVYVQNVSLADLARSDQNKPCDSSKIIRERVVKARQIQQNRSLMMESELDNTDPMAIPDDKQKIKIINYDKITQSVLVNAALSAKQVERYIRLSPEDEKFFISACEKLSLSARSFHKTLRVARTIADLDGSQTVEHQHLSQALNFRFQSL